MLDGVLDLYAKRLQAKEIAITKRSRSDWTIINSYPGEIRQVLSTLLLNALEATASGGTISVGIRKSFHWNNSGSDGVRVAHCRQWYRHSSTEPCSYLRAFLHDEGRTRYRTRPMGRKRNYQPPGRLDSGAQQCASREERYLFFYLSSRTIAETG